jgi:Bacterial Ig-like domain (group 3)/FG-GAP-like repeat
MQSQGRWIKSVASLVLCVAAMAGTAEATAVQVQAKATRPNLKDLRAAAAKRAGVQPLPFKSSASYRPTKGPYTSAAGAVSPRSQTSDGVSFSGFQRSDASTVTTANDNSLVVSTIAIDVNKDGLPDVVTVQQDGALNVTLNPGKGKLNSLKLTSVNTGALELSDDQVAYAVAADLDGDGYPEIMELDVAANAVYTFKNLKDGTFAFPTSNVANFTTAQIMSLANGGGGGGFSVGDVTGDGLPDLVVVMMTPPINNPFDPGPKFTFIELLTFPGKGDGTFGAPLPEQSFPVLLPESMNVPQMTLADTDHDGHLDLVYVADVANAANFVTVMHGNNDGTFASPPTAFPSSGAVGIGTDNIAGGFSVQDVDGDGNLDILYSTFTSPTYFGVTTSQSNVYLAYGNGDGTFQPAITAISTLGYPQSLNFADATGDGIVDVIAYYDGYIAIYPGISPGTFAQWPAYQISSGVVGTSHALPADFDGDGVPDLARVDAYSGLLSIYSGANHFAAAPQALNAPQINANYFQVLATGKFDGDNFPDILALDSTDETHFISFGPNVMVGHNDGTGKFKYTAAIPEDQFKDSLFVIAGGVVEPLATDWNKDGVADILVMVPSGFAPATTLSIALSQPDGSYGPLTPISLAGQQPLCGLIHMDTGDLNGDGIPDLVATYPGDHVCYFGDGPVPPGIFVFLGKGDGTFTSSFTPVGNAPYDVKLIDLNGDGKLDLALSDAYFGFFSNQVGFYVIPGRGDGTFDVANLREPFPNAQISTIIPGDFDGDGKQDLTLGVITDVDASGNPVPNSTGIAFLKGNGDFTFGSPQVQLMGAAPMSGQYADFNGDGIVDLALNVASFQTLQYPNTEVAASSQAPVPSSFGYMAGVGGGVFGQFHQTDLGSNAQPGGASPNGVGIPGSIAELAGFNTVLSDSNDYGKVLVADFNGDGSLDVLSPLVATPLFNASSSLFLNRGGLNIGLTSSADSIAQGTGVTLSVTLLPTVTSTAVTGNVSFFANGTLLGSAPVSGNAANLVTTALPSGKETITLIYSGDANYNAASPTLSTLVSVGPAPAPAITMQAPNPASIIVPQGGSSSMVFSLLANPTFSGAVQLSCSGAPAESTCTASPGLVTLAGGQSQAVTVFVTTTAPNNQYAPVSALMVGGTGGVSLSGLLLVVLSPRRRKLFRNLRLTVLLLTIGTLTLLSTTGCGGDGNKYTGTPKGVTTLTVTATSGSLTATQAVQLTVN